MNIGYIGLGAMGGTLARRLVPAHDLTVWDIREAAATDFAKRGATVAATAAELARRCDVILLCLPRSADVRELMFGTTGVAEALAPGKIIIDQTSGTPAETIHIAEELARRGVSMLEAPVSGSPPLVAAGGATIMVSGPDEIHERAWPVLRLLGEKVLRCGKRLGDAQAMKLVNNTMNSGFRHGTLEIVAMARKAGLSLQTVTGIVNDGLAKNNVTRNTLPALLEDRSSTDFALALMLKDLNQSTVIGMECGAPMPIAGLVRGLLQVGVNTLGQHARLEDVVKLLETMARTSIAGPAQPMDREPSPEEREAIAGAAAACNFAVTWEAAVFGLKFGLSMDHMAQVLTTSSAWSAVGELVLPTLAAGRRDLHLRIGDMVKQLRRAARMAAECGSPLFVASLARSTFEAAAQELGDDTDVGRIADFVAAMAATGFPRA